MLVMILLSTLEMIMLILIAKIDKLNASLSSLKIENEKLIAKAKDLNVVSISNLRDENAILHDVEILMLMLFMIT
jgi:hypothetical protein